MLWLRPKCSREANSPHPIKGILRHLLAWGALHSEVTVCALFLPKFAVKWAAVFARGVRLVPKRVHSPEVHFRLLNGLLQPCLLWCFPSAPGNDNHLERQPARNRWQQKICSALSSRMSYLPWTAGLWTRVPIMSLGMPVGLAGNRSHLDQLARWFYFRKHRRISPHPTPTLVC